MKDVLMSSSKLIAPTYHWIVSSQAPGVHLKACNGYYNNEICGFLQQNVSIVEKAETYIFASQGQISWPPCPTYLNLAPNYKSAGQYEYARFTPAGEY